jgi:hypothetical protein
MNEQTQISSNGARCDASKCKEPLAWEIDAPVVNKRNSGCGDTAQNDCVIPNNHAGLDTAEKQL